MFNNESNGCYEKPQLVIWLRVIVILFQVGLADVWLYTGLEFTKLAIPDAMTLTPWVKQFTEAFEADACMKKYLSERPESPMKL